MTTETLDKANALQRKIKAFEKALECFDYEIGEPGNSHIYDREPKIQFEVDDFDGGSEIIKIPLQLNDHFVDLFRKEIKEQLAIARNEFADLK